MPYQDPNPFLQSRGMQLAQIINSVGGFQSIAHAMEAQRKLGPSAFGILYGRGFPVQTEDELARNRVRADEEKDLTQVHLQQLLQQLESQRNAQAMQGQQIQGQYGLEGMRNQNALQLQNMQDNRALGLAQMQAQQNQQDNMTRLQQQRMLGSQSMRQQELRGRQNQDYLRDQMGYQAQGEERDYLRQVNQAFGQQMKQLSNLSTRLKDPGKKELQEIAKQSADIEKAYSDGSLSFTEYLKARAEVANRAFQTPWDQHMAPYGTLPDDTITQGFVQWRKGQDGSFEQIGYDPKMDMEEFTKKTQIPIKDPVTGETVAWRIIDPLKGTSTVVQKQAAKPAAAAKLPPAEKPMTTLDKFSDFYNNLQLNNPEMSHEELMVKAQQMVDAYKAVIMPGQGGQNQMPKAPPQIMGRRSEMDARSMMPPPGAGGPPPPMQQQQQGPIQPHPEQENADAAAAWDQRKNVAIAAGYTDLADAIETVKQFYLKGTIPPESIGIYNQAMTTIQRYARERPIQSQVPLSTIRRPPNVPIPGQGQSSDMRPMW